MAKSAIATVYACLRHHGRFTHGPTPVVAQIALATHLPLLHVRQALGLLDRLHLVKGERKGPRSFVWVEAQQPRATGLRHRYPSSRMIYVATVLGALDVDPSLSQQVFEEHLRRHLPGIEAEGLDVAALATTVKRWMQNV